MRFKLIGTPEKRFLARFKKGIETECWEWIHTKQKTGYGVFKWNYKTFLAHRFSYENYVGSIPNKLVIDHLCRNRSCVNPNHLEPVTIYENLRRGKILVDPLFGTRIKNGLTRRRPRQSKLPIRTHTNKTQCINGHEKTPDNVTSTKWSGGTYNRCKTCHDLQRKKWRENNRWYQNFYYQRYRKYTRLLTRNGTKE